MTKSATAVDDSDQAEEETRYVAMQRLRVGADKDGNGIFREYGETIPEALEWNSIIRARYLQEGRIAQVAVVPRGRGRPARKEA